MSLEIQNGGFLNSESYKTEEFCDEIAYFDERCEMQIPRFYDFIGDPKFEKFDTETDEIYRWFFIDHSFTKNNFSHIRRFQLNDDTKSTSDLSNNNRCKTPLFMKMERMKEAYNRHIEKIRSKAGSSNCNTSTNHGK